MFTRLQKLGISLSSSGTLRAVDKLGERHDEELLTWVNCLQPLVPTTQVLAKLAVTSNSVHVFKTNYNFRES